MDELVQRLTEGTHPVRVGGSQSASLEDLKKRVADTKYVFIKFTDTRGGTDLGVRVDTEKTNLSQSDFEHGTGIAHIEGSLTLNYVKVRCIADISLATLEGTGYLVALEETLP
ncbi:MAG TPA: hypothetical protein VFN35_15410 [Ktedonobacteraceae bacterium]|nr:hypothetical protein [Ktedonobacteraceae bacterium]